MFVRREKVRRFGRVTFSPWVFLILIVVAFQMLRALFDPDIPDNVAVLGLRFLYLASIVASIRWFDTEQRTVLVNNLARILVVFLLIEVVIAMQQIVNGPATLGTTAFGARPWGTFSSPNNLGLALLGVALILVMSTIRYRWVWIFVAVGMTFAVGSRTAILAAVVLLAAVVSAKWRRRGLLIPVAAIALVALYQFTTSEAVSGRVIDGEARLDVWGAALSQLTTAAEWLFGLGLGYGSNAAATALGTANLTASVAYSDSMLVSMVLSQGFVGLALLVAAFITVAVRLQFDRRFIILAPLLIAGFSFNVTELSPINILAAVAIGVSMKLIPMTAKALPPEVASSYSR